MASSSIFSNRLLRSRSILKKCAANSQIVSPCAGNASSSNDYKSQRLYHGPLSISSSSQQQHAFSTTIMRGPLSNSSGQQRRQQRRHDRQKIYFSSSPQESSSVDADSDDPDDSDDDNTTTADARASKPTIDPNEVEIERRKVKDVPIREVLDVSSGFAFHCGIARIHSFCRSSQLIACCHFISIIFSRQNMLTVG